MKSPLQTGVVPVVLAILSILNDTQASAQTDTVHVPDFFDNGAGTLNRAVTTAVQAGTLSGTVFKLKLCGRYVLDSTITIPAGTRLTIVADPPGRDQQTAPPQILWSAGEKVATAYNFRCYGDIVLRNIWLFYANTAGVQTATSLKIEESPDVINGQHGTFDGCLFDYSQIGADGSGAVSVTSTHFRGVFSNCYFKNCVDRHYRYYGRAVSFPFGSQGWHIDSVRFENCTFANIGYVYNQEGGEYGDNVSFNHCTFFNVAMYPLESGWWHKLSVTNSVFANTWLVGNIFSTLEPEGGTLTIDSVANFGFSVPFTEQERRILFTNSSYMLQEWVGDWMVNNPGSVQAREDGHPEWVPVPQPMLNQRTLRFFDSTANGEKCFPYMNSADLYDSADPGFILPPTDTVALAQFLYIKWWCCSDTLWAYYPERSLNREWPMRENLAYRNPTLLTAGMGGFPLGDLYHWFPTEYEEWQSQRGDENTRILTWMHTGTDPGIVAVDQPRGTGVPARFALGQNFPNPFNATTQIEVALPEEGHVALKVYNLLGQEVATLIDDIRHAGDFVATFDGAGCAAGVYFYRLQTRDFMATKKLILLK